MKLIELKEKIEKLERDGVDVHKNITVIYGEDEIECEITDLFVWGNSILLGVE